MSSIQTFAERLLFGTQLEDKLFHPQKIDLQKFSPASTPQHPGRPDHLLFSKERLAFPKDFASPHSRGIALQFFANHELLAIELMALCLLRFPDAPVNFQRGIIHIISEEQRHLRLYLSRAKQLGVEAGAVPVNSFFWDCLADMQDPMDFVVGMGLTFEQANLDHCIYYGRLFEAVDDDETVDILNQVYLDEIRHVKHGLHWFRKWKQPEQADFFVHEKALTLPLSPMRAKGLYFDVKARKEIGFDDDYIQRLQVYSLSKGRPSDVYLFRPNCELDQTGQEPKKIAKEMERALAPLMLFLAQKDDIVVSEALPLSLLQEFQQVGIYLPQFVRDVTALKDRYLGRFYPWGWSSKIALELGKEFPKNHRKLYGKAWGAELLQEFLIKSEEEILCPIETVGRACFSVEQLLEEGQKLQKLGYQDHVLKANFGTAGRTSKRASFPYEEALLLWAKKILNQQKQIVLEPRLLRLVDYSIQIQVREEQIKQLAVGRFETSEQGQYLGHHLGAFQKGLDRDILRFLHGDGKDKHRFRRINAAITQFVGKRLQREGFRGPAGVDAFIYRDCQGSFKIRPIVEINPRVTMGRIAFEAGKYMHPKSVGDFKILPIQRVAWQDIKREDGKWRAGVIPLTSPKNQVVAILDIRES